MHVNIHSLTREVYSTRKRSWFELERVLSLITLKLKFWRPEIFNSGRSRLPICRGSDFKMGPLCQRLHRDLGKDMPVAKG